MRATFLAPTLLIAALSGLTISGQITVYSAGNIAVGDTRSMTAYVPLNDPNVTWSVNGVVGGNSTYGTITSTGTYTATYSAPSTIPSNNVITVAATSVADTTKSGSVNLTITQPQVNLWSISPTSTPAGSFTIRLNGSNFGSNSVVKFGSTTLAAMLTSGTGITATGTATAAQVGTSVPITVTNTGLGSTTSAAVKLKITAASPITVTVSPAAASVPASTTAQFSATVSGSTNTAVTWSVNGTAGGSSATGTISSTGLYTAPSSVPSPAAVTIQATSAASSSATGTATVTIQPPPPAPVTVTVLPASVTVAPGSSQAFTASLTNTSNTSVTWSVNGVVGGNATIGSISTTGVYTAPSVAPSPATVTIAATSVASPSSSGAATASIAGAPNPGTGQGTPNLSAARFLEQAAFGPTPTEIANVQTLGVDGWLTQQFNMPETSTPDPAVAGGSLQSQYLSWLSRAPDQLRQRVAYALSQIIVISMNKNIYDNEILPYLQILSHDAFGNYRTLLGDISVSSQMGMYLDLAHSTKPSAGGGANENYARELMQLFTIGIWKLNPDGSQQLDSLGNPIPTYDQATVQQVALALTGWTYINDAWQDFSGPMVPLEANHDTSQKTFLGCTLLAGQTTTQDMNGVLDCLFQHPNMGPFIATRLIRSMVTSNPSPAYIQRIATVFNDNGSGVRGDLRAVVKAILTDPERATM